MKGKQSFWFKLGLVLLAINYPVGLGSIWIAGILFVKTKALVWLVLGGGFYLLSWLLLLTGFMLAGQQGLRRIRFFWRRTRRRIKLLHLRVNNENNTGTPGNRI